LAACAYTCGGGTKTIRTVDEHPRFRKKKQGDEIYAEMSGGGGNSLGVPWILEPRSPIRVPLYHACPIQHSLHENQTGQGHTTPRTRMKMKRSE